MPIAAVESRGQRVEERRSLGAIRIDEAFTSKLPPPGTFESASLVEDVRRHGVLVPLLLSADGLLLDGHRRFAAAKAAGLAEVPVVVLAGLPGASGAAAASRAGPTSEWERVVSLATNLHHRVLTPGQRVALATSLERIERVKAHERRTEGARTGSRLTNAKRYNGETLPHEKQSKAQAREGTTVSRVAKSIGLHVDTYQKGRAVLRGGNPELAQGLISGRLSVNAAAKALAARKAAEAPPLGPVADLGAGGFRCVLVDLTSETRPSLRALIGYRLAELADAVEGAHAWFLTPWPEVRSGAFHALLAGLETEWISEVLWSEVGGPGASKPSRELLVFSALGAAKGVPDACGFEFPSGEDLLQVLEGVSPGPRVALFRGAVRDGWKAWNTDAAAAVS